MPLLSDLQSHIAARALEFRTSGHRLELVDTYADSTTCATCGHISCIVGGVWMRMDPRVEPPAAVWVGLFWLLFVPAWALGHAIRAIGGRS